MTFSQMLKLARDYYDSTMSRFDNIQHWLNMTKAKDEPVSTFMEKVSVTAKRLKVGTLSEEEWIIHRYLLEDTQGIGGDLPEVIGNLSG